MIRFILVNFVSLFILSCNNGEDSGCAADSTSSKDKPSKPANHLGGCYMRVVQKDTLAASLLHEGNKVFGTFFFDNYQKDGSTGTVSGSIEGEILKLVYRFHSEGTGSISEMFFKVTPGGLIQGFGDVQVKGDSAYYSDPANVRYPAGAVLRKMQCIDLPAKYKDQATGK